MNMPIFSNVHEHVAEVDRWPRRRGRKTCSRSVHDITKVVRISSELLCGKQVRLGWVVHPTLSKEKEDRENRGRSGVAQSGKGSLT